MTAVPSHSVFQRCDPDSTFITVPTGDARTFDLLGARLDYERNAEIYGEGEPVEFICKVISGAVRVSKLLEDGRRQIGAFHLPGEVFGLEAGAEHRFTAEAVTDSRILLVQRAAFLAIAARDAQVSRELWEVTARDLCRAQDHMLLLGRRTALEKVAAFLLDMAARTPAAAVVELPMSRYDIADYLGLTIETVSRTLTVLENRKAIALPASRRIVLANPAALRALNA